jgi:glyoxylase-like metal-dependent hydrolase (beta-lactamase superfamily II)
MTGITFHRDFEVEYGRLETVSPLVRRIVARNPGPFTFKGTGTYVVGHGRVAIIDPGPALVEHIDALLEAVRGESVDHILITHTHLDHSPAAAALKQATGARTYGFGPHGSGRPASAQEIQEGADRDFVPDETLRDGDVVEGVGWRLAALHTPGHTSNHLSFALPEERTLFPGDHVMGWSTSVITPPDGDMADYMRSLEKLLDRDDRLYWPTHGPAIPDPIPHVRAFIAHRRERSDAILQAVAGGAETVEAIVLRVYVDLAPALRPAAARSALAHLIELVALGQVDSDTPPTLGSRYRRSRS